jgi:ferritin-like protein
MHPAIAQLWQYFAYTHLPPHLQAISKPCHDLAAAMMAMLPENPEVTVGLRKLLEAKDCFVRAALANAQDTPAPEERTF